MTECKKKRQLTKAIILGLAAALSFSCMALFVKLASPHTNNPTMIFVRFAFGSILVFMIMGRRKLKGKDIPWRTNNFRLHFIRALASLIAMSMVFLAIHYLSLVNSNLLVMTNPLFIFIISALIFHHKSSPKSWVALFLGFIGVIFILKPGHEIFNIHALIGLGAGLALAVSFLWVNYVSKKEPALTCILYYFPLMLIFSSIIVFFYWQTPSLHTLLLLLGIGIFGSLYQTFLIIASIYISAKNVSMLLYTSLIFSGVFDWIFWGHTPDLMTYAGVVFVLIGCIGILKTT